MYEKQKPHFGVKIEKEKPGKKYVFYRTAETVKNIRNISDIERGQPPDSDSADGRAPAANPPRNNNNRRPSRLVIGFDFRAAPKATVSRVILYARIDI